MKKLLTPLFVFFLSYGMSQSLSLIYDGETLENNQTITVHLPSGQIEDEFVHIDITNNSANEYALKIKKEIIQLADSAILVFCISTEGCISGDTSETPEPLSPGQTLSRFFKIQYTPTPGTSEANFTFFNVENPADKNVFKIIFDMPLGIKQSSTPAVSLHAYPNPATEKVTIEYNLVNQTSSTFVLKNMMGVTVLEEPLYRKADKIDISISNIPRGLYFYSIINDENTILAKKLIVK